MCRQPNDARARQGRLIGLPSLGLVVLTCAALTSAGCTEVHVQAGAIPGQAAALPGALISKRPSMSVLEGTLRPGVSKKSDVLATLGPRTGAGAIFLPIDRSPREVWSYYYEEATVRAQRGVMSGESGRTFLFVYFDDDRYDGYMWFSSLP